MATSSRPALEWHRGQLVSRVVRSQSIAVAVRNLVQRAHSARPEAALCARSTDTPPRESRPPGRDSRDQPTLPLNDRPLWAGTSSARENPVTAFVVACRRGPPGGANGPATALQRPRSACAELLLAARSQTAAFESPGRHRRAPGITPAAAVLPELVTLFIRTVTSLEGSCPRAHRRAPALPGRSRLRPPLADDFSGQKREAPAYPSTTAVRSSAPSPFAFTGRPSRAVHG